MRVRQFDPACDTIEALTMLWNEYYGMVLFTPAMFARLNPQNVFVAEAGEELVGFAVLLDGGMPYAVLDQLYVRPEYRRFTLARLFFQAVEIECRKRGIQWYYGLLDGLGNEPDTFMEVMKKRYVHWNAHYLGEKPMFCKSLRDDGDSGLTPSP